MQLTSDLQRHWYAFGLIQVAPSLRPDSEMGSEGISMPLELTWVAPPLWPDPEMEMDYEGIYAFSAH